MTELLEKEIKTCFEKANLFNQIVKLENRLKNELDISIIEVSILFYLWQFGELNMGALVENIELPMSTATGIVDKLVSRQIVSRERKPGDKRVMVLKLADKGKEILVHADSFLAIFHEPRKKRVEQAIGKITKTEINLEWE